VRIPHGSSRNGGRGPREALPTKLGNVLARVRGVETANGRRNAGDLEHLVHALILKPKPVPLVPSNDVGSNVGVKSAKSSVNRVSPSGRKGGGMRNTCSVKVTQHMTRNRLGTGNTVAVDHFSVIRQVIGQNRRLKRRTIEHIRTRTIPSIRKSASGIDAGVGAGGKKGKHVVDVPVNPPEANKMAKRNLAKL